VLMKIENFWEVMA